MTWFNLKKKEQLNKGDYDKVTLSIEDFLSYQKEIDRYEKGLCFDMEQMPVVKKLIHGGLDPAKKKLFYASNGDGTVDVWNMHSQNESSGVLYVNEKLSPLESVWEDVKNASRNKYPGNLRHWMDKEHELEKPKKERKVSKEVDGLTELVGFMPCHYIIYMTSETGELNTLFFGDGDAEAEANRYVDKFQKDGKFYKCNEGIYKGLHFLSNDEGDRWYNPNNEEIKPTMLHKAVSERQFYIFDDQKKDYKGCTE